MRRLTCGVVIGAIVACAASAVCAAPIEAVYEPVFDAEAVSTGPGAFVLNDGPASINTLQDDSTGLDSRGVLEFDVSAIPDGALITVATLRLDVVAVTLADGAYPTPRFYAYAGDGVADTDDPQRTDTLVADDVTVSQLGKLFPFQLDVPPIQNLVNQSDYLGVLVRGSQNGAGLSFSTSEFELIIPGVTPLLELTYIPLIPADVNRDGSADVLDISPFIDVLLGNAPFVETADVNGDGAVDSLDSLPFMALIMDTSPVIADVNGDGSADVLDISPFIDVLLGNAPFVETADVNGDGTVDVLDIQPFSQRVSGADAAATPEPAAAIPLLVGVLLLRRRR